MNKRNFYTKKKLTISRLLCSVIFLLSLFCNVTYATIDKQFLVENININETANNSAIAKVKGLKKAELDAFFSILYYLYPETSIDAKKLFSYSDINDTIVKYTIENEQSFKTQYQAKIKYYFDAYKVVDLLNREELLQYANNLEDFLFIPILYKDNEITMWENTWTAEWIKASNAYGFYVLKEDLDSIQKINAENFSWLQIDKKTYPVKDVLIAKVIQVSSDTLTIILERPLAYQMKKIIFSNSQNKEGFYKAVIDNLMPKLFEGMEVENVSIIDKDNYYCQITIPGSVDWNSARKMLVNYNYTVQYISSDVITVEIRNIEELKSLEKKLRKNNYYINKLSETQWLLDKNH